MTRRDLGLLQTFQEQTVIAVRAPEETQMEIPFPSQVGASGAGPAPLRPPRAQNPSLRPELCCCAAGQRPDPPEGHSGAHRRPRRRAGSGSRRGNRRRLPGLGGEPDQDKGPVTRSGPAALVWDRNRSELQSARLNCRGGGAHRTERLLNPLLQVLGVLRGTAEQAATGRTARPGSAPDPGGGTPACDAVL